MKYIVFEGADGMGKSTLMSAVNAALGGKHSVMTIQEPGTGLVGKFIRGGIKDPDSGFTTVGNTEMLLLMQAAREEVFRNLPDHSQVVLADRCWISSVAFQVTNDPELLELFSKSLSALKATVSATQNGMLVLVHGEQSVAASRRLARGEYCQMEQIGDAEERKRWTVYELMARLIQNHTAAVGSNVLPTELFNIRQLLSKVRWKQQLVVPASMTTDEQLEMVLPYINDYLAN